MLQNTGRVKHDFVLTGLNATVTKPGRHGQGLHVHAMPGESDLVEFVPLGTGTYEAVCTIPGHKEAGMRVAITVVN